MRKMLFDYRMPRFIFMTFFAIIGACIASYALLYHSSAGGIFFVLLLWGLVLFLLYGILGWLPIFWKLTKEDISKIPCSSAMLKDILYNAKVVGIWRTFTTLSSLQIYVWKFLAELPEAKTMEEVDTLERKYLFDVGEDG